MVLPRFYVVVKGPRWEELEFIHSLQSAKERLVCATLCKEAGMEEQPLLTVYELDTLSERFHIKDVMTFICRPEFFLLNVDEIYDSMDSLCECISSIL